MSIWSNITAGKQTGGIWEQVLNIHPAPIQPGRENIWTIFGNRPGGMWQELEDETVILSRDKTYTFWQKVNEETLIIRPKCNLWSLMKQQVRPQTDYQPGIWEEIGQETLVLSRPGKVIWSQASARDFTGLKPDKRPGWALKKLYKANGEGYFILKNIREARYMRLNEQQVFLWHLMDGEHSIQDIAVAFFVKYQKMAIQSLIAFLGQLEVNGFLINPRLNIYNHINKTTHKPGLRQRLTGFIQRFSTISISISSLDKLFGWLYKLGGFLLFTAPVRVLMLLTTLAGMVLFAVQVLQGNQSVFMGSQQQLILGLVLYYAAQAAAILLHELAHALTVKHYGREVRRAGLMIYFGMPALFVDTTDIWMEARKPRLEVSWAGPFSGFFLAGLATLTGLLFQDHWLHGFLFQFAFASVLVSISNLNPLLRLDGYYMLMDWLEIPMLRSQALDFVRNRFFRKLGKRENFSKNEKIFTLFGALSLGWTLFAVISMGSVFGRKIYQYLTSFFVPEIVITALALIVLILLFIFLQPMLKPAKAK